MQKPVQMFQSDCKKATILVENDMPIGVFHDFLMMMKGSMVDRMVTAHKEQVEQAEEIKKSQVEEPEEENAEPESCTV